MPLSATEIERWTSTVVLGDGTSALIRPISPDDRDDLAAFHARQSHESRYRRFFSPKPELNDDELDRFTNVDFVDRAALVIEEHGDFVAWASYERWQNRDDAEVAFMVDDERQGVGIATLLLEHLAAIARSNDITRFTAQTLGDNRSMLAVFSKAGWPVHRRFDSGVIDVDFPLEDTSEFIDSVERREQRSDSRAMARLLLPKSIAVIGASPEPGSIGQALWSNLMRTAKERPLYPVNPNHTVIGGHRCFASITDIPDRIALAIIAVPAPALEATIDQCIEKRVRGAVVITSLEAADTAVDLDIDELVAHARRSGLRIIGPASIGIASSLPDVALSALVIDADVPPGQVAISLQSGTLGSSVLRLADELEIGLSWFVSLGDKTDVSANDLLQFWQDDVATRVIAIYTESLGNPRKFARIARRASARTPIVAVRTGAALIGLGNEALYRQTGVIEVPTVTAMLDTARVFASAPLMEGDRVAVLSNARSPRVLAAATLVEAGLEPVTSTRLDWRSEAEEFERAVRATLADDGIDAVMVIHAPPVASAIESATDAIVAGAQGADKPIVAVLLGSGDGPLGVFHDDHGPLQGFAFPEQAAAALGRLRAYSRWREDEGAVVDGEGLVRIDPQAAGDLIDQHVDDGTMPPELIGDLLDSYGVEMPVTRLVDAERAPAVAQAIGYPVAIKASKRHAGRSVEAGIGLDLRSDADVAAAIATMQAHLGADADRVVVQPMIPPGNDLRVRATLDERVGPVITVGLGGVQADAIGDRSSRLAPVSPAVARSMVAATRAAGLLDDDSIDAVTDVAVRVAQLVSDHPEIVDLDLNPVIVSDGGCFVADAWITLRRPERPRPAFRRLE